MSIQPFTLFVMLKDNEVLIGFCYLHFYARKIRNIQPRVWINRRGFLIINLFGSWSKLSNPAFYTDFKWEQLYIYTCLKIGCVIIFLKTWILTTHIYRSFDPFEETYIREEFILGHPSYMWLIIIISAAFWYPRRSRY